VSTPDALAAALRYAAAGWPVFPTRPDDPACANPKCHECKAPLTLHGFEDATAEPGTIGAWWRRWPRANVAIATGAPGPDVLDVDVKPDGDGWAAFGRLKRAGLLTGASLLVRTRSGGLHVYFAGTGQRKGALPRHHLDFQACGGYVIAPPSSVHGRPYEVIDHRPATAALDWATAKQVLDPPRPRRVNPGGWSGGELPRAVQRALVAPADDRSAALYRLVGACVGSGLDEGTVHQVAAGYQPALEKYGDRLPVEVDRCLAKIGAA
jgi:hypothetical protein